MKSRICKFLGIQSLCFMLVTGLGMGFGGMTALAGDDLQLDDFYEYDMTTGKEKEYRLNLPDADSDELVLEGYEGRNPGREAAETEESAVKEKQYRAKSAKKYCSEWVTRDGNKYYYNKNGELLKNGIYKVKGSWYYFDKTGKRTSGEIMDEAGFCNVFSKKTGKLRYRYLPLKVTRVSGNAEDGCSFVGRSYKASGSAKKAEYVISGKEKLVNRGGKRVKASSIGKGAVLKIYTKSMNVLETFPMQIPNIIKVEVVKKGVK